jgi:iron complex transport system substrate-binding protein
MSESSKIFLHSAFGKSLFALFQLTLLIACHPVGNRMQENVGETRIVLQPDYAKGFRIINENNQDYLEIYDSRKENSLLDKILLVRSPYAVPETAPASKTIEIPVKQFITLSATQWGMLLQLDESDRIAGISEAPFVREGAMKSMLESGAVIEVARDGLFHYELLGAFLGAVMLYSPDAAGLPEPIYSLKLIPLPWPDYTEPHPLGRAEWLRLLGFLTDKQSYADSIFASISAQYVKLSEMANLAISRPKVFSDKLFAGQWYVPGGKSYIARIFKDAGAEYVFNDLDATGSVPLDPEAILAKAAGADYWRIPHAGNIGGYSGLLAENQVYGEFAAFKNRRVIFCNTLESGYFERGPLEPNLILADFIAIFHPELLPAHKPRYHFLLQ